MQSACVGTFVLPRRRGFPQVGVLRQRQGLSATSLVRSDAATSLLIYKDMSSLSSLHHNP